MKDNKNNIDKGTIALYKSEDGQVQIDVKLEHETLWLNLNQISSLFGRDKSVISRHINNLYKEKELPKHSTVANFATVQTEGNRRILRQIEHFNLDIIISVGYRVKSKHGTQFRIWANKVLKDYLVNGYVLNEKRLKEKHSAKLRELESSIAIFKRLSEKQRLHQDEFSGVLQVIRDYTHALDTLDKYDHQQLSITNIEKNEKYRIDYKDSRELVNNISEQFTSSSLFGKEKDKSFESALKTIYQTFGKKELYPSLEEKAANLLYMIIKNHSFVDGNKRIAAAIFLMYLAKNNYLYSPQGEKRIADNALVALCLMIAESNPKEKDIIIKVIVNLINKDN